jgi:predicted O-methyltransferase YrrM
VKIAKSLATDGWLYASEIDWLAQQAQSHHHIVELGCMLGRSTRALADNTPGFVLAFDWFQGPPDSTGEVTYHFPKPDNQLEQFKANLADHISTGKVVIKIGDHRQFTYDGTPDMVFIDGDHQYEKVHADIEEWKARLAVGGLLCGHDFCIPDVERAVKELVPDYAIAHDTSIWYWTKI